jgi:hypothetical protein
MPRTRAKANRVEDLRAMLAAYRRLTIEEAEESDWGDVQIEIEGELWRLEQEIYNRRLRETSAA